MSATGRSQFPLAETGGGPGARISSAGFLAALGTSGLALALSAIILLTGYLVFLPGSAGPLKAAAGSDTGPRTIQGKDLQPRLGTGQATEDGAMQLTGMHKGEDERAILTRKTSFSASDYLFIEYQLRERHPEQAVYLIWRTAEQPEQVSSMPLHWHGNRLATAFLGRQPQWQGRITEIGLDIYGNLRGQPLIISGLSLLGASRAELLRAVWSEWTAFTGWSQTSANFLRGTPKNPILSPTLALAAWSGLALILLAGLGRFTRSHHLMACVGVVLIPWMVLDQLWQANLSTQLEETRYLFAGKSQHEKHLADWSPELYDYAQYLKKEVLPEPGPRIFLLHDSEPMTYTRLKAQYYLLPHNIFNYDRFPRKKDARAGDYILVLGNVDGLEFSPEGRVLRWQGKSLPVKLVDSRPDGSLFKVKKPRKNKLEPAP